MLISSVGGRFPCGTRYLSHCRTTPAATLTFWGRVTSSEGRRPASACAAISCSGDGEQLSWCPSSGCFRPSTTSLTVVIVRFFPSSRHRQQVYWFPLSRLNPYTNPDLLTAFAAAPLPPPAKCHSTAVTITVTDATGLIVVWVCARLWVRRRGSVVRELRSTRWRLRPARGLLALLSHLPPVHSPVQFYRTPSVRLLPSSDLRWTRTKSTD